MFDANREWLAIRDLAAWTRRAPDPIRVCVAPACPRQDFPITPADTCACCGRPTELATL